MSDREPSTVFYTVGHSNRSLAAFLDLLEGWGVEHLVDVRRFPASRRFPHFNRETLSASLGERAIGYEWVEALGGRRSSPFADSPNRGLRVAGFRNYADHMLTEPFRGAVDALVATAAERRVAVMCAERLYWRCHRRLISDHLHARGHRVVHILEAEQRREHTLSPAAQIVGDGVRYPEWPLGAAGDG